MRFSLPSLALKRPIAVLMLVISLLGLGAIAYSRIPLEFIPKLDFPFIACFIPYPGATPEQVENEVAIPAEGEFRTLSNLERIRTYSDGNGCNIRLQFAWDTDMALATAEVRDRIERLKLKLPAEIDRIFLQRYSTESMPIMGVAMFWENDEEELTHLVRTLVQPRILRLDGVADVTVFGRPEKEVLIEFDQDALRSANLGLYQVVSALQTSSLNLSLGELVEGQTNYFVRALDEFTSPEQIGNLVIGPNSLRLKNVATVKYSSRDLGFEYDIDGKHGAGLFVQKESEANVVATCKAVRAELERLRTDPDFGGIELFFFWDQSEIILTALRGVREAGKYGGSLALIVLFLFLRRIRPTLLVAFAIPTSLVAGFVFMFFTGITLNIITMVSMIIALGMLVDNSIVVMENIHRHQQLGLDAGEAVRRGASEVALAITAATMTTVVVFVPMFYLRTGDMGMYMRQFAAPVTVSLIASLVIALTVIPLAASRMKQPKHLKLYRLILALAVRAERRLSTRARRGLRAVRQLHPLKRAITAYVWSVNLAVNWRLATLSLLAALVVLTYLVPAKNLKIQRLPRMDPRELEIEVILDQTADMTVARDIFAKLKAHLDAQRKELNIKNVFTSYKPEGGSILAYLLQPEDYPPGEGPTYSTQEVFDILKERLPTRLPGAELHLAIPESEEDQDRGLAVHMRGEETRSLTTYTERFKALLAGLPKVDDVVTDADRAKQEVQIRIDEDLSEKAGVSPMLIARSVDFALRGIRLPYLKQGGREIPVWAQFREEDRTSKANLDNVAVITQRGALVPLNQLVSFRKARSPQGIRRVNGKNVITIRAKTSTDDLAAIRRDVQDLIDSFALPRGYSIDLGRDFLQLDTDMTNFVTTLLLSIVLIYIVMGALFESYVLPLSILTSVPLALIGVYWAMYLTDTPMDTVAYIGIILMVGVVVNNGIVIVDYINRLRRNGYERLEAILQAGRDRFRPVMMTALTTILACVPLAVGGGVRGEIPFSSLGRALIGGLTTGTLLTLFIVPLFYSLIDDFRVWFLGYLAELAAFARGTRPEIRESSAE